MKYKIKDRVLLGFLGGMIGSLAKNFCEELLVKKGWNISTGAQMASRVFNDQKFIKNPICKLIGNLANMGIGAGLGIPFVYLLSLSGKDYIMLKGATMGHLAWVYFYGGVGSRMRMSRVFPIDPKSNCSAFLSHIIYGVTVASVVKALADEDIFKGKGVMENRLIFKYRNGKYYLAKRN